MNVHKINNNPINSNCYVVIFDTSNDCIVIDPGTKNNKELLTFLTVKDMFPAMVILTHEHFDHCAGVNHLNQLFNFELICSENASQRINNPKLNFSEYWDGIESFGINMQPRVIKDSEIIKFANISLRFIITPGHSPGSMCVFFKDGIFTGDTVLNNLKTPLKLPHGDKNEYKESIHKLNNILRHGMKIFPGHGESFSFKTAEIN